MKKLISLLSLMLILAALIVAPKPAIAQSSCPLPGSSAAQYCYDDCTSIYGEPNCGSYGCQECYTSCDGSLEQQAVRECEQAGVCCNY